MRLVLEHKGDNAGGFSAFAQDPVVDLVNVEVAEVVPRGRVAGACTGLDAAVLGIVGRLGDLAAIHAAPAFEGVVRVAGGCLVEYK